MEGKNANNVLFFFSLVYSINIFINGRNGRAPKSNSVENQWKRRFINLYDSNDKLIADCVKNQDFSL